MAAERADVSGMGSAEWSGLERLVDDLADVIIGIGPR
jgi:hypothetical protein